MGFVVFTIFLIFFFLGIYYACKTIIYYLIYKKMNVSNNIKCFITVDDAENNLEMFFRKFLYIYLDNDIFSNITIVTKNMNKNTYYLLEQVEKENNFINIINNADIEIKEL